MTADDRLVYDLDGIGGRCDELRRELPGVRVRFALKACPVDEVLGHLARRGIGVDAASPQEITQALRAGVPLGRIHYGNTVKSDRAIAHAHRLGVRDYATDSVEDVRALAAHAPRSRVFCRLSTTGDGALWGLSEKFGCAPEDAAEILLTAREAGLVPAGLSVHVGSQQMTTEAWQDAFADLDRTLTAVRRRGLVLDHVNLGGGLPALGYADRHGNPLDPPLDKIFAVLRDGMQYLRDMHGEHLAFVVEPGRHLVADHGVVRAHVVRLTRRRDRDGTPRHWLYLSVGRFNGLYETDAVQYPLDFPAHPGADRDRVLARVAGPTCDSDDAFPGLIRVPRGLASGDPVRVLSSGAYATSYMTRGFNGFAPLPHTCVGGERP
ncbi:type III PLP-dependent enzyme [Streptomyces sp. SID14478]|uniref:type III PLP-dependent enzyme n=1 Tax=Streptomyces sp. SID14478 TaxID=2706073 RepID=UPI0013DB6494|nr:type III PLP-dependent enzyme [Streptomyces sp. SID14478]NEB76462.1 type III PLP-dependent enzyme [Streptomyces sp. SID14478]